MSLIPSIQRLLTRERPTIPAGIHVRAARALRTARQSARTARVGTGLPPPHATIGTVFGTLLFVLSALIGCDESLPPRIEPAVVLVPSIRVLPATTVAFRDSMPVGTQGAFQAEVLNVYDEVLQDTARIRLNLEVWLRDQPNVRANVLGTEEDLVNYRILTGKVLTLGIDTAAVIRKQWNHRTNEGVPFWTYVPLGPGMTLNGEPFCGSDTVTFRVKGTIQLFNIVQPQILPEWEFRIVYRIFGITCDTPPPPPE